MATATTSKLTKDERKTINDGLTMYLRSLERSAKGAKTDTIAKAFTEEGFRVATIMNRINSGELDL